MEFPSKYRLEKRLGTQRKGKFGELFLATDTRTNRKVVLKALIINPNNSVPSKQLKAEASFSFDFEGLPKVMDFEETASNIFLVRQYIEGVPLDEYWGQLKRRKRLAFVIKLLEKIQPQFDHLKSLEIVHCDIKPSNILISSEADTFSAHLLDFGLSIRTSEKEENEQRKLLFPLGFAAPELLLNHLELVDHRTDMFALGVVIWRLYAGSLPLAHPNPSVFTNLQLTHPLPEHTEVSKKIHNILSKMAHKHQFDLPPNQMNQNEVRQALASAMDMRYTSWSEIIHAFKLIEKKRFWQ